MQGRNKETEVLIEESFDASPQRVFSAWTDPEKLKQWFVPDGCTLVFKRIDIRVGGGFHSRIDNPQFGPCWCVGEYKEIIPDQKIVFTMVNADEQGHPIDPASIGMDKDWPGETLVTVTFKAENGKTIMRLEQTVSEVLAKKTGAYPSWLQMLAGMKEMLKTE